MPKAPQQILEIRQTNPAAPTDFATTGAATIALGQAQPSAGFGGNFPSVDARQEWKQVLAPNEDYDVDLVGASGWVLGPKTSGGDLPFDHPFDTDWEFMLAVDPAYSSLLARGNQVPEEDPNIVNRARNLQIPVPEGSDGAPSLLGVEIDGGLVPNAFQDGVHVAEGDRMAVFGRWIVDCGHAVTVPVPNPGDATYRSEIHPPLLMASARVTGGGLATGSPVGPQVTRVLFTSRPYLVGQHFTTDQNNAYSDVDPADDGPFVDHMVNEYLKVNDTLPIIGLPTPWEGSSMVEAHPKIKSSPYHGAFLAHLVVRPPGATVAPIAAPPAAAAAEAPAAGLAHVPPAVLTRLAEAGWAPAAPAEAAAVRVNLPPRPDSRQLQISYQFTVRTGCAVEITSTEPDTIDVFIAFGHGVSPPLPPGNERTWSKDELAAIDSDATTAFLGVDLISGLIQALKLNPIGIGVVEEILSRGIKTYEYDTGPLRSVNILDHNHAVGVTARQLPNTEGVITDNNQPYPVFGWLEVGWVSPEVKLAG